MKRIALVAGLGSMVVAGAAGIALPTSDGFSVKSAGTLGEFR